MNKIVVQCFAANQNAAARIKKILCSLLILCLIGVACDNNKPKQKNILLYEKTELGGCNLKSALRSGNSVTEESDDDKINITITEESVNVFVGLNYTCKTIPFETKAEMVDDVICMYIIDSCNEGCYERCTCYYMFDFVFKRESVAPLNQRYKMLLVDPRKEENRIIAEGVITE